MTVLLGQFLPNVGSNLGVVAKHIPVGIQLLQIRILSEEVITVTVVMKQLCIYWN